MFKKNNWFKDYEKQRDLNFRKEYFLKDDFKNASVIDIGCNTGQLCRYAADLGATNILGIERAFSNLDVDTQTAKLAFIAINLIWLGIGLYKMSSMQLLPTTSADFADSIVWKEMMETSSIPPVIA